MFKSLVKIGLVSMLAVGSLYAEGYKYAAWIGCKEDSSSAYVFTSHCINAIYVDGKNELYKIENETNGYIFLKEHFDLKVIVKQAYPGFIYRAHVILRDNGNEVFNKTSNKNYDVIHVGN